MPEGVLQQLGELGHLHAAHGDRAVDEGVVEAPDGLEGRLVDAGDDLGRVDEREGRVAGVDALGAVAQEEVVAGDEPRPLFEDGSDQLLSRPRVGGRLQDHGGARPDVAGQGGGCLLDIGEVGVALPQRRRNGDHREVEARRRAGVGRRLVSARVEGGPQPVVADVLHERLADGEALDPVLVDVVADDPVALVDGPHGQWEPHISLTDDDELGGRHFGHALRVRALPRWH